jgi:hypothetical protein
MGEFHDAVVVARFEGEAIDFPCPQAIAEDL